MSGAPVSILRFIILIYLQEGQIMSEQKHRKKNVEMALTWLLLNHSLFNVSFQVPDTVLPFICLEDRGFIRALSTPDVWTSG